MPAEPDRGPAAVITPGGETGGGRGGGTDGARRLPAGLSWRADTKQWLVHKHDLADVVLRDPHVGMELAPDRVPVPLPAPDEVPSVAQFFELWYQRGANQPAFGRHLRRAYAPAAVAGFAAPFTELAERRAAALPGAGDLVTDFVEPFCLDSTFLLMGFPPGRWPALAKVYRIIMSVLLARSRGVLDLPARQAAAFTTALRYLRAAVDELTAGAAVTPVVASLQAHAEAEGPDPWADVAAVAQLLAAGVPQVTTGTAVACRSAYGDPALLAALREGTSDASDVAEEAMRLAPPFLGVYGWVLADCDCLGVRLLPGEAVVVDIVAVNRDPDRMADPLAFCPGRSRSLNITFGKGAHYCLGAASARLQVVAGLVGLVGSRGVHPDVSGFRLTDDGFAQAARAFPYRAADG
ncbi:Cytochrome P450 [Micromonospora viridifaciens]|uniref:Cytochrome P450 n=1 Tax=Micromonospora viridifaciens TaxID=1881 RepID=A0A1C4ZQF6_MICVI|nr:cytochrome P450 [Micromonospora viridifaciens]SCF35243.1 Cytochrome P450 [Micromonospora viridifaciens]